jgi:hypothetical protein
MDRTRWDRASATLQPGPIESPQHDNGPSNFHKWARVNFRRWAKVSCQTQLIEAAITAAIRKVLMAGLPKSGPASGRPPEMVAVTASWATYGAVKEWINTPGHPSAENVVPLITQLIVPILESAAQVVDLDGYGQQRVSFL